ncbi:5-methylcytosine-specific restriction protein A [Mobilisporobacter senegalensis]|uniref:5-methylcytosine-specific restriction protein A n=1 Tax=Mobilisporobacter senegalensis TaxID=1329262 RepID=A0A3N1XN60_9FIRM|nr:DUF3578 domain-containing protein [Mobilisporobacter senegalensis]ROR28133.1 5-methylcytosine-specific restriction protein A [Mobilisporobacter senegalensis]
MDNIGTKLKDIRLSKGLSLAQVSEAMGWPISRISKIENQAQKPLYYDVQLLAEYYAVNLLSLEANDIRNAVRSSTAEELSISEKIREAAQLYKKEPFAGSVVGDIITKEIPSILIRQASLNQRKFLVTGSIGKGQYAEIPWVAIFNRRITDSATYGIYIVYLFTADMKGVYLSLNQGFTYFKDKFGNKQGKEEISNMAMYLRKHTPIPMSMREYSISLNSTKQLGKGYEAGHIAGKYYDVKNLPSDEIMISDLLELIDAYDDINVQITNNRLVEQFYDYIVEASKGNVEEDQIIGTSQKIAIETNIEDNPEQKNEPVIGKDGLKRYLRSPINSQVALQKANFMCECDNTHYSFKARNSDYMYVEAHHLVPISKGDQFGYSLDVPANIISLCPNCHRCVHLGEDQEKENILRKLYEDRKDRLEKVQINVTFEQIKKIYNLV